jgi:membrane fusion protein (multidrug efflux system)
MRNLLPCLGILLLVGCGDEKKASSPSAPPPASVDVMIADYISTTNILECNGTVLAAEMVELHPETSGRLVSVTMNDGAHVSRGTLLAKINDAELQAQLKQQNVQLDLARKNKARFEKLIAINGVNQADYDAAIAQVASLEAAVAITQAQIDKTEIRAPFNGTLGLRQISPGAYVKPENILGMIQEDGPLRVDFTLPEQFSGRLKKGTSIQIITAIGDTIASTVSAFDPLVNSQTRNIKARAVVGAGTLLPGAYVKVKLGNPMKGILVPTQSIVPDATSDKLMVVKDGRGMFVNVKTGFRTPDLVEIVDGISTGDTVIVTGVLFVRPKSEVRIKSVKDLSGYTY